MAKTIKVKSAFKQQPDGGHKLAIFERNEVHPDGELFIGDDKVHEVAMTPGVALALNEGRLVDVTSGDDSEEAAPGGDTMASLMKQTKEDLTKLAEARGLEVAPSATKEDIAQSILEAQ